MASEEVTSDQTVDQTVDQIPDPAAVFDTPPDEPQTPAEPESSSQPEEVTPDATDRSILDWWQKKYGETPDYQDNDDFVEHIAGELNKVPTPEQIYRYEQLSKMEPVLAEWQAQQAEQSRQAAQAQQQPAEVVDESKWTPFKLDQVAIELIKSGHITVDSKTGEFTGPDVISVHVSNANRLRNDERDRGQRVIDAPFSVVREDGLDKFMTDFRKSVLEEAESKLEAKFAAIQSQNDLYQLQSQYPDGLNKLGENGAVLKDSAGNLQRTPKGEVFDDAVIDVSDVMGLSIDSKPSPEQQIKILQFATKQAERFDDFTAVAPAAEETVPVTETPAETKKSNQRRFTDAAKNNGRNNRLTNEDSSIASAAAAAMMPQSENLADIYEQIVAESG